MKSNKNYSYQTLYFGLATNIGSSGGGGGLELLSSSTLSRYLTNIKNMAQGTISVERCRIRVNFTSSKGLKLKYSQVSQLTEPTSWTTKTYNQKEMNRAELVNTPYRRTIVVNQITAIKARIKGKCSSPMVVRHLALNKVLSFKMKLTSWLYALKLTEVSLTGSISGRTWCIW